MSRHRKRSRQIVHIANPPAGGSAYTSARRAADHVARGLAEYTTTTPLTIRFLPQHVLRAQRREAAYSEAESLVTMRGVILWNGADRSPTAMHRPGEVVS